MEKKTRAGKSREMHLRTLVEALFGMAEFSVDKADVYVRISLYIIKIYIFTLKRYTLHTSKVKPVQYR